MESKKAALSQPLSLRKDYGKNYDDVEGTMIKPLPATPPPTPEEALSENITNIVPSTPQSFTDYDNPMPINKGCGGPLGKGPMGPKGFDIECPVCKDVNKYIPEEGEEIDQKVIILCPKCANSVHIEDFVKTASGTYTAKIATCLDDDFKAIRRVLPKKSKNITLSNNDISMIHSKLDKIYKTYRKFEKELDK
jgi:hypothetical protein